MRKRGGAISGFGSAIDSTLKEHELDAAIRPHRAVVLWPEVVGEVLAAASEAEVVRSGVLFVRARSTTWANELTFYKADLLKKINQRLGGRVIEDIHFKAGGRRPARNTRRASAEDGPKGPTDSELRAIPLASRQQPALPESLDSQLRHTLERAARTREWKRAQGWPVCELCGALYPPIDQKTQRPDANKSVCPYCAIKRA